MYSIQLVYENSATSTAVEKYRVLENNIIVFEGTYIECYLEICRISYELLNKDFYYD